MENRDYNVNVTPYPERSFLPCILCSEKLRLRIAKTGKPYFVCESCGIQLFIRRNAGIEKLKQILNRVNTKQKLLETLSLDFLAFQSRLEEIEKLRQQLKIIEEKIRIIFADEKDLQIRDALKNQLKYKIEELENFPNQIENPTLSRKIESQKIEIGRAHV